MRLTGERKYLKETLCFNRKARNEDEALPLLILTSGIPASRRSRYDILSNSMGNVKIIRKIR